MEHQLNLYDLSQYRWILQLKGRNPIQGNFVSFSVTRPTIDDIGTLETFYPSSPLSEFAFCPVSNWNEFQQTNYRPSEVPDYIIFFKKPDIESLQLITPLI